MSASQRKGKGKATGKRKRGDSSQSIIALMHDSSWQEKNFTQQEKADQLLPESIPGENSEDSRSTPAVHHRVNQAKRLVLSGENTDRGQCILSPRILLQLLPHDPRCTEPERKADSGH
ncbi:hypothetical protein HN873_035976 [Arachis hypogaea]